MLARATSETQGRLMFVNLVKKVIKDIDEETDEEIHRLRSGGFCPCGVGVHPSLGICGYVHQTESPSNLMLLGFYVGFLT